MEPNTQILTEQDISIRMPSMYAVIMYNDDVTTMEFVVDLLIKVFHKSAIEASNVMMDIHQHGQGIAGIYTYDIAVTKKAQADQLSAEKSFPLRLSVQEAL
jgi:ATP-dependent Clp protease adaptor protein ClpS